ncbi:MAG: Uma2 family endonuclease [Chthoniobacterales bacterium]|nr:Uma2 family endonuclease [Chthoniobacterales bacterium]
MPTTVATGKNVEWQLLTADEFLDWLQPGVFADLIDGEKFMHSPVHLKHARLVDFMRTLLKHYVERRGLGEILSEVWAVRLDARTVFMPDICYFTTGQVAALTPTHARFAPRMVVEVLSRTTGDRDVGPKFAAYEHHEVEEYWILDPHELAHRFYAREGELLVEFAHDEERIASRAIPGFWVAREWLNPEALPPVLECLERSLSETS